MLFTRILCVLLCTGVFISCSTLRPALPQPPPPTPEQEFKSAIDRLLNDSIFIPAHVGIRIVSLTHGDVLYDLNGKKLFHPASIVKLFSSALALCTLGKDFVFTTRILADTLRDSSVVDGDLYLKGSGNPDLTVNDLRTMVLQIRKKGICRITGDLVGDVQYFDDTEWGSGWMWDDDPTSDVMHISALSINKNCVSVSITPNSKPGKPVWVTLYPATSYVTLKNEGVTGIDSSQNTIEITRPIRPQANTIIVRGSIPQSASIVRDKINVWQPEMYTLTLFKEELMRAGIVVGGTLRLDTVPSWYTTLADHSWKLDTVLIAMNTTSDNLAAENLLKTVAAEKRKERGSTAGGLQELNTWLNTSGFDTTHFAIVDGSGLSFYNLLSPDIVVRLLEVMYSKEDTGEVFRRTLPIAGESGSLRTRMNQTSAGGKIFAKTGTLSGVSSLSGYAQAADGEVLAFSIIMQDFTGAVKPYRNIQDSLSVLLSSFRR